MKGFGGGLKSKSMESPEECEEYALSMNATGFSWTKFEHISNPGMCYPKVGDIMSNGVALNLGAFLPCP